MTETQEIDNPGSNFTQVLDAAAKLPGVRINRAAYLRTALKRHCTEEQIKRAIADSPAAAGIPLKVIAEVANTSIAYETSKVTGLSTLAGIPGGLAMIGTVPADLAQYMGHMLRIAQKLAYIYSWPDLFADAGDEIDEATESMLILFVGVMFGVQIAQGGVAKVADMIAANVAKKLPQQALTQGIIYPDREKGRRLSRCEYDQEALRQRSREGHPRRRCSSLRRPHPGHIPPHVQAAAKAPRQPGADQARTPDRRGRDHRRRSHQLSRSHPFQIVFHTPGTGTPSAGHSRDRARVRSGIDPLLRAQSWPASAGIAAGLGGPRVILQEGRARAARLGGLHGRAAETMQRAESCLAHLPRTLRGFSVHWLQLVSMGLAGPGVIARTPIIRV